MAEEDLAKAARCVTEAIGHLERTRPELARLLLRVQEIIGRQLHTERSAKRKGLKLV